MLLSLWRRCEGHVSASEHAPQMRWDCAWRFSSKDLGQASTGGPRGS